MALELPRAAASAHQPVILARGGPVEVSWEHTSGQIGVIEHRLKLSRTVSRCPMCAGVFHSELSCYLKA
jgi:hypothetical protein